MRLDKMRDRVVRCGPRPRNMLFVARVNMGNKHPPSWVAQVLGDNRSGSEGEIVPVGERPPASKRDPVWGDGG